MNCLLEHAQAILKIDRPERLAPLGKRISTPDVVDQNIQSFMPPFDTSDQLFHFRRLSVVHPYGDAESTGSGDQFGGFLDGFRSTRSCKPSSGTPPGAVNRRSSLAQCDGNAPAGSAGCSGNQRNFALQYSPRRFHAFSVLDSKPATNASHSASIVGR